MVRKERVIWNGPSDGKLCRLADKAGCWANPEWVLQNRGGNFCDRQYHNSDSREASDQFSTVYFDIFTTYILVYVFKQVLVSNGALFPLKCPPLLKSGRSLGERSFGGPRVYF